MSIEEDQTIASYKMNTNLNGHYRSDYVKPHQKSLVSFTTMANFSKTHKPLLGKPQTIYWARNGLWVRPQIKYHSLQKYWRTQNNPTSNQKQRKKIKWLYWKSTSPFPQLPIKASKGVAAIVKLNFTLSDIFNKKKKNVTCFKWK